jgi:hypothetical protein
MLFAIALVGLPAPAAADFWCVDQSETLDVPADFAACGSPVTCVGGTSYPTIRLALDAIADGVLVWPVCVATPGVHVESLSIDLTGDEEPTPIFWPSNELPNFCPDGAVPGPAFSVVGDGSEQQLSITRLHLEGCPVDRPLALLDSIGLNLLETRVLGGSGPLIDATAAGSDQLVDIVNSRIEGIDGQVYVGTAHLSFVLSELSGSVSAGQPLLHVLGQPTYSGSAGAADIYAVLFGNTTSGAPLLRVEASLQVEYSVLSGNVVIGGSPLFHLVLPDVEAPTLVSLEGVVFSRNRLLATGSLPAPTIFSRPVVVPQEGDFCRYHGTDQLGTVSRPLPAVTGVTGDASLLWIEGAGTSSGGVVSLMKSFVVDNEIGAGGAVVELTGTYPGLQLNLIHNTVSTTGLLVEAGGIGPDARLALARNLYVEPPAVALNASFATAEVILEAAEDGAEWLAEFAGLSGIQGPIPPPLDYGDLFRPEDVVAAWTDLQRAEASCPQFADPNPLVPGSAVLCALDSARAYLPTDSALAAGTVPWVWENSILEILGFGDPSNMPGATGWVCPAGVSPTDDVGTSGDNIGDLDGYSSLVDCDNESAGTQPSLPSQNGYDTEVCVDEPDDCYVCPVLGPGDDDDSTQDDDDDSSQDDDDAADDDDSSDDDDLSDDDDSSDDDDNNNINRGRIHEGCDRGGCGFSWSWAAVVCLPLLGLRRRRAGVTGVDTNDARPRRR